MSNLNTSYYYFSTHTMVDTVYNRLKAGWEYTILEEESQEMLDKLVDEYPRGDFKTSPMEYCSRFILKHEEQLEDLISIKGRNLKYFLTQYLGFSFRWGASTTSYGKNSVKRAEGIPEKELIQEMIDPKGSIKKLLDSAGGDLNSVKPFLPAIMISLDTNTRNRSLMEFKHTGRFCFDFDKLKDQKEAQDWLNKVWKGTKNIKPYMGFISPRGKGFKIFCKVDTGTSDFMRDFKLEEREVVMKHHKVWYEGARKELARAFPELEDKIDISTNDPQRLTYLPFISDPVQNFKYSSNNISNYSEIVNKERDLERKALMQKISEHSKEISEIMRDNKIKSKEDAYHLLVKNRSHNFDLELETDKFTKVVSFIEELSSKDNRVSNWVYEKFNDYHTLHKLSWVLYGVFGDLAIEELKKLIPPGSNKLDENHNDYRWAVRSKDDYSDEQLRTLTPGAFYAVVNQLGEVKDFISEEYRVSSGNVTDFKLLRDYYETYIRNINLLEEDEENADLAEFLDEITDYIDKKKVRLPLISELDDLESEVSLGPSEYLDKTYMTYLFQNKYASKRIFSLRSQCGTGKNTIAGNPEYKVPGRVILAEPYRSISDQLASEAWNSDNSEAEQLFSNSGIEDTLMSFKKEDEEIIKVSYENSLREVDLPSGKELVVSTTYNQVLNLSHEQLATFSYIFIDEAHSLSDGLNYRADVISALIFHLVQFIAKKRDNCKTKIIFMSGTPNVETHVIPELMEEYSIKSLFQRIIVDKKYKVSPILNLTHLDTEDTAEREDAVINQINTYIKQGRKVCHIFNNKSKMDEYIRSLQSKLSEKIKVGLFYSGSIGTCTQNILQGKFGEYDVVLATTYFINGININRDGLTPKDIESGVTSNQKYGMVIDLGRRHTKVNAMDAIQAINRFRNRKCHATVFLPKIFKADAKNTSRTFNFKSAGKVLLGINRFNHHLLSVNTDSKPYEIEEEEGKDKIHLLEEVRRNPLFVSLNDINKASREERDKERVVDLINKKSRIYNDWFSSLDGYHYLAKDAGFISIIKHRSTSSSLEEVSEDQTLLENKVIENFLSDDKAMIYLDNNIEPDKRILVKSSGKITQPMSTKAENFHVVSSLNGRYIVEGDFHVSHERAVNRLISNHLRLCYWYGRETAIDILRFIVNPRTKFVNINSKSLLKTINSYITSCKAAQSEKLYQCYSYIRGLDILSSENLGVKKEVLETSIIYSIERPEIAAALKNQWADQQYSMTLYKISNSKSSERKELLEYYSNAELVKDYDIQGLEENLNHLGSYKSFVSRDGRESRSSVESLKIPRILRSDVLLDFSDIEVHRLEAPKVSSMSDFKNKVNVVKGKLLRSIKDHLDELKLDPTGKNIAEKIEDKLNKNLFLDTVKLLEVEIPELSINPTLLGKLETHLNSIVTKIKDLNSIYYSSFETAEYSNYQDLKIHKQILFVRNTLFCEEDFTLESLDLSLSAKAKSLPPEKIYEALYVSEGNRKRSKLPLYLALDPVNGDILVCTTSKTTFCKNICIYAYKNRPFIMSDGSSPKLEFDKGPYKASTFRRDYLVATSSNKIILNYTLQIMDLDYKAYNSYISKLM
jgi:hypothetical protein